MSDVNSVTLQLAPDLAKDAREVAEAAGHKGLQTYLRELLVMAVHRFRLGSPAKFWDRCAAHDWYYEMSDDHSKWVAGRDAQKELRAMAASGGDDFVDIYESYFNRARANMRGQQLPELMPRPADEDE